MFGYVTIGLWLASGGPATAIPPDERAAAAPAGTGQGHASDNEECELMQRQAGPLKLAADKIKEKEDKIKEKFDELKEERVVDLSENVYPGNTTLWNEVQSCYNNYSEDELLSFFNESGTNNSEENFKTPPETYTRAFTLGGSIDEDQPRVWVMKNMVNCTVKGPCVYEPYTESDNPDKKGTVHRNYFNVYYYPKKNVSLMQNPGFANAINNSMLDDQPTMQITYDNAPVIDEFRWWCLCGFKVWLGHTYLNGDEGGDLSAHFLMVPLTGEGNTPVSC